MRKTAWKYGGTECNAPSNHYWGAYKVFGFFFFGTPKRQIVGLIHGKPKSLQFLKVTCQDKSMSARNRQTICNDSPTHYEDPRH